MAYTPGEVFKVNDRVYVYIWWSWFILVIKKNEKTCIGLPRANNNLGLNFPRATFLKLSEL